MWHFPIVPGTGGVRKARWARPGRGKSGGVRVIYYYWRTIEASAQQAWDREVYLLSVYAKNESGHDCRGSKRGEEVCEGFERCRKASR
jgi:hypothetical protein